MKAAFKTYITGTLPRVLTHLDKDPDSPTYGCFDRDFWHYKIRDFSSAILQQTCYSINNLHHFMPISKSLQKRWLTATLNYWSILPSKNGALNEYYPHEEGFPPTAFSLQAITKILLEHPKLMTKAIESQIHVTMQYLLTTFEDEALNQQAAGLAALAQVQKLGITIDKKAIEKVAKRFFAMQDEEGWFPEYGGPDLGYLSVTIDMLYDYYEVTEDERALTAMKKAADFISLFIETDGSFVAIANSRETQYIVPYGLVRLGKHYKKAWGLAKALFYNCTSPDHFVQAVDDRYHLHYVFNSFVRAYPHLKDMQSAKVPIPSGETYLENSSILIHREKNETIVIAGKKGGSVYSRVGKKVLRDYGWRGSLGAKVYVTNIHSKSYKLSRKKNSITVSGNFLPAPYLVPEPLKWAVMRAGSFILGKQVMSVAKKAIIFKKPSRKFRLTRTIYLKDGTIQDSISGKGVFQIWRAPPQPTRQVASAFSYSGRDLSPQSEKKTTAKGTFSTSTKLIP